MFKIKKNILAKIILLLLLPFVIGCSIQKENGPSMGGIKTRIEEIKTSLSKIKEDAKMESAQNEQHTYLIGVSQNNLTDSWRSVMLTHIKAEASKHPELKMIYTDSYNDNNKQVSDIESFIQKKVDLIISSPNEAKPLTEVLKKAYDSGIPVILLDRSIEGDSYTQFIAADNFLIGEKSGEWVADYLGPEGGNIVEIMGSLGTSAQEGRHNGFLKGLSKNPNVKIISSRSSDWRRDKAIAVMEGMLEENKRIDVVFAHNDSSAEGAYTAAKNAGREDEMVFVGIDAVPTLDGGIQSILSGRIDVTYLYPTGGKEAVQSAYKLLVEGEKLDKHLLLDTMEITVDNAYEVLNSLNR